MASLPLINHNHPNVLCALQSTANIFKIFNDFPSSMPPVLHTRISHQCPNIRFTMPKSYGKVSEQFTAQGETWDLKQENQLNFEAWRLGVETNTLRSWTVVPPEFVESVKSYMIGSGSQYVRDLQMVAKESMAYVNSLTLSGDGKDAWLFDVDETLLSSMPFFASRQYGYDYERNATEKNLALAGYHSWEALLLREPGDYEKSAVVFKSERRLKIEQDGFRILGNSGDQWSDLTGYAVGDRTFKLPNPMYYTV